MVNKMVDLNSITLAPNEKLYFAYGANIAVEDMAIRCPAARALGVFYLNNWQLLFCTHATISKCKIGESTTDQEFVPGVLWAITDKCERALDLFEGFPSYYYKEYISTDNQISNNRIMFYVMTPSASVQYRLPYVSYYMTIERGYKYWGIDVSILEAAIEHTRRLPNACEIDWERNIEYLKE